MKQVQVEIDRLFASGRELGEVDRWPAEAVALGSLV